MLRVTTINLNGVRAATKKGFFDWLKIHQPDVLCMQEVRALPEQMVVEAREPEGYFVKWHAAEKKGYSGVGIYSKIPPKDIIEGSGIAEFDKEGRFLQFDFENYSVASLYVPSGTSSPERQEFKMELLAHLKKRFKKHGQSSRPLLWCGDINIAHQQIDIENWRGNQKNSGFLPEERAYLDEVFGKIGWVDCFRKLNSNAKEYSWWSQRGQARAKNVGWRIDYHMANRAFADTAQSTSIYREQNFSDHAPVTVDYAII